MGLQDPVRQPEFPGGAHSGQHGFRLASSSMRHALLFSVFVIASCGLAYELIAAALSSYLLGDSVTQFSTVIGTYLFAMGVGSWLSKLRHPRPDRALHPDRTDGRPARRLLGGRVVPGVRLAAGAVPPAALLAVFGVGVLVGLEIPLVMRILKRDLDFKDLVVAGAHFRLPRRAGGLRRSFRCARAAARLVRSGAAVRPDQRARGALGLHGSSATSCRPGAGWHCSAGRVFALLAAGLAGAGQLTTLAEAQLYADHIVHAESTPYQRIVVTRWRDDLRLFLNGNLQFSSHDEYRYHEALVHPGLASLPRAKRVLVLGGGDGLALREILKYPQIEAVTLVDLDPAMTELFSSAPPLRELNRGALKSPNASASSTPTRCTGWRRARDHFDFVVVDFPIRPTSRSASCTRAPSTACSSSAWRPTAWSSSSPPRRSTRASRSGAW